MCIKGRKLSEDSLPAYCWNEIQKHTSKHDRWLVIDGDVYDVTSWSKRHPGGERILANHAGQDATDAWIAFHNDKKAVSKYLNCLKIGTLLEQEKKNSELTKDFRQLRRLVEDKGLFKASVPFFTFILAHIILLEFLGWLTIFWFGTGWLTLLVSSLFLVSAQGVSSAWWNNRHYLHHAKPNIIRKDPDIRLDQLFLCGSKLPLEWAKERKGFMPYNHQHRYWFLVMPPLLLPLYFNFEVPYFLWSRRLYREMFWTFTFFVRYVAMFFPFLGLWGSLSLYLWVRFLESHWFVWTTQMNHIPMEVDYDLDHEWVTAQLRATCNVDQSLFNDWFSGHLNFQIEHHLFPTMPRNNLHKTTPMVKALCEKHGLNYQCKPLSQAMKDIVRSLKTSGDLWLEAYNM